MHCIFQGTLFFGIFSYWYFSKFKPLMAVTLVSFIASLVEAMAICIGSITWEMQSLFFTLMINEKLPIAVRRFFHFEHHVTKILWQIDSVTNLRFPICQSARVYPVHIFFFCHFSFSCFVTLSVYLNIHHSDSRYIVKKVFT